MAQPVKNPLGMWETRVQSLGWGDLLERERLPKTRIMGSSPITSWQIDVETMETVTDFIFLCSKITADSDYSHEIKTLASCKKSYDKLSVLKSRDITLPMKSI